MSIFLSSGRHITSCEGVVRAKSAAVWVAPLLGDGLLDSLPGNNSRCATQDSPCSLVPSLAADFVTSFLSHYLPPEKWWLLPYTIAHSLIPPPLNLTPEQEFFSGAHLFGFSQIANSAGCSVTHTWEVPVSNGNGSVTLSGP